MDEQPSNPDFLSNLPLGLIHLILSFVPIREVIMGTSTLSKKWKYIWTGLPHLAFDEECHCYLFRKNEIEREKKTESEEETDSDEETERDTERLIGFISLVLYFHRGPIHTLEILLPHLNTPSHYFDQWLLFLPMYSIRTLLLELRCEIHSVLYSCLNLTHLRLHVSTILPPPSSFEGFLFLRSLDISMGVPGSIIESIIAHCPVLEELTLSGNQYPEITIRAPNLKIFHFKCGSIHLSLCTPLLEVLTVKFNDVKHFSFDGSSVFHLLRTVKLSNVPFDRREVMMAVGRLITRCPNLQKLSISNLRSGKDDAPACVSFGDIESAPHFTYDCLKVIKTTFYGCGINEMNLIKFLLARSPVLERMIYRPGSTLTEEVLLNLTDELLTCQRASANAEIVIDKSVAKLADHIHQMIFGLVRAAV